MKVYANGLTALHVGNHELTVQKDGTIDVPPEHLPEALSHGCTLQPLAPAAHELGPQNADELREVIGGLIAEQFAGLQLSKPQLDIVTKNVSTELAKAFASDLAKFSELAKRLYAVEAAQAELAKRLPPAEAPKV